MTKIANTKQIISKVEEHMALSYRIEMVPDVDGWFVSIPDLPGCISQGATPEEALEMIQDAQRLWLQVSLEQGHDIPVPSTQEDYIYSGKFNVRVPKDLHRDLANSAEAQGVSLLLFVATTLASAVNSKRKSRPPAPKTNSMGNKPRVAVKK